MPDATVDLFASLPIPVCLTDCDGLLVAMNPRALAFWNLTPDAVVGRRAVDVLGVVPEGASDPWRYFSRNRQAMSLFCQVRTPDDQLHRVSIFTTPLDGQAPPRNVLFILSRELQESLMGIPDWALRDPVTGLGNRHTWERQAELWQERSGCVVFLDLDDLKEVNDLHGHIAGDRILAAIGRLLLSLAPPDAHTVRYGGDEFVVLLPNPDLATAEAWAEGVVRQAAQAGESADWPIVPRLSHGVAAFGPGELPQAVRLADDLLYQRKGVLLTAESGGRIILTRQGRAAIRRPGDPRGQSMAGVFGASFGPDFDQYVRAQYARAVEQAREFVAFVDPPRGGAVIEVGAGSGRITFDGGLADRIGRRGQLIVTDPSRAQLQGLRRRAEEQGCDWICYLQAPAEELPMASGTVDLVLGALFLQFTDPERALREMARVIRPGGRIAFLTGLAFPFPPAWTEIAAPIRQELEAHGLPQRTIFPTEREIRAHVAASSLRIARETIQTEYIDFPSADIAEAFWHQNGLVPLLLQGVPTYRHRSVQEAFDSRLRTVFARTEPEERRLILQGLTLVAEKPG